MKSTITTNLIEDLGASLIVQLQLSQVKLSTDIPKKIEKHLSSAMKITKETKKIIGEKTHGAYFDSSIERYNQYFAISEAFLPKGSMVLDIGNAPGHVSIGLHLLGLKVQGINLNNQWLSTYPSPEWPKRFNILALDIETELLPFDDNSFDAIFFTEVLEHIAIIDPEKILPEFLRVLKPGGIFVLSTPNICNISNIFSLINGKNIFWPSEIFYGSLDRHNREYTPQEVLDLVTKIGFKDIVMYGINCYSNWRSGGAELANDTINKYGDNHSLLRNTIMLYAFK